MVRSDYRLPVDAGCPSLPGSLRLDLDLPVRRALGRAGDAPHADAARGGRGPPGRAGRRRAGLGQEPARARVRRRGGEEGALVLYGACDAVVRTPYGPVRRGARPARAGHSTPSELRAALGAGGGELTRLLPDLPRSDRRAAGAGRGRPRHRAPPPPHGRDRPARERQPRRPVAARARGRALGRRPDAPAPAPPGALRRSARAAGARDIPRHRGGRAGGALGDARRPAPLRRRRPAAARRALRRRGRRVRAPRRRRRTRARAARARRATIHDLTEGNAFLVCELWRALVETGAVEVGRRRDPADAAARRSSAAPESVREVVSQRLSRLAPQTTDLLELAAVGRDGVRARRRPPRRRPRASPSCSPRSRRRSAAA